MASNRLSRRRFLEITGLSVAGVGVLGVGYARGVEPGWVDLERVEVSLAGMSRAFDRYRVVQISDVHANGWMTPERLSDVIRRVNGERPNLVVVTGDLVTADDLSDVSASEVAPRLVGPLREVRARDGAVAVLGNHDHWVDAGLVRRVLGDGDFRDIGNRHFSVRRGGGVLHFAGVDDVMEGRDRLGAVLDGLPGDGAAVLLALGEKYPAGRHEVGGMVQYTNRGLGLIQSRLRFGCRPETTTFVLRAGAG